MVPPYGVYEDSSETVMVSAAQKQAQKAIQGREPLATNTAFTKAAQIALRASRPQMRSKRRTKALHER
jgi:hypothetical protein